MPLRLRMFASCSSRSPSAPLALRAAPLLRAARALAAGVAALALASAAFAQNATLKIVAAENFYGDVAKQIGGARVAVSSVLSNPDQDPHLFEASPKVARELQHADLVIYNGADYDPWMAKLLAASKNAKRATVVVAELVGKKAGDNPHLWYDPATMPAAARARRGARLGRPRAQGRVRREPREVRRVDEADRREGGRAARATRACP